MPHALAGRVCAGVLLAAAASAGEPAAEQVAFFESRIRPVLIEHCYRCHSEQAKAEKKLKGGLLLDSRAGLLAGGDLGPALVPGDPARSLLMKAVRWEDPNLQMPPRTKLPDAAIADLAAWIATGAVDPRAGQAPAGKAAIDLAKGREHWAFKPLAPPPPPAVQDAVWSRTAIDRFVRARQEAAGIAASRSVSPAQLIRRATFDLHGLPPTPEEVEAFTSDQGADAYEQVVDRLLASPRYGERWARHWLDVARYGESNGYEFDAYRNGAYHYRDWVIRALNAGMPYDEFVRQQVAGDLLKPGDFDAACATGFLVAGPYPGQITAKTKERIRYDQLDDMVSAIGGSMLGLTMGCVRCHDHQFDPIPQKDYYGLAAALARTVHSEQKVDRRPEAERRRTAEHEAAAKPLREALAAFLAKDFPARFATWQRDQLPTLAAEAPWQALEATHADARLADLEITAEGEVTTLAKAAKDDTYTIRAQTNQRGIRAIRIDAFADRRLPKGGPGLAEDGGFALGDAKVTVKPVDAKKGKPANIKLKAGAATVAGDDVDQVLDNSPESAWRVGPAVGRDHALVLVVDGAPIAVDGTAEIEVVLAFPDHAPGRLRLSMHADARGLPEPAGAAKPPAAKPEARKDAPPAKDAKDKPKEPAPVPAKPEPGAAIATPTLAEPVESQALREIRRLLERAGGMLADADKPQMLRWYARFDAHAAKVANAVRDHERLAPRPDLVPVYTTKGGGEEVYFLRRGEVDNKEGRSPPGFVQVLTGADPARWLANGGSAADPRVALARWLTDAEGGAGQLLARVMVNRLWKHHLGRGLVASSNDFGTQGDRPTHPELLDHLARELIAGGWQLKPIHKRIMLSETYRLGAETPAEARAKDPDNTLWWQRPARRLEAEAIRDALLAVSGRLDATMHGPAIAEFAKPRRSVYLRSKRSEPFAFFSLFDAPEPTASVGDRGSTTQPTQALTMLNSPFVRAAAEGVRERAMKAGSGPAAVQAAYRIALGRAPAPAELARCLAFVERQKGLADPKAGASEVVALTELCLVLLCSNEFIYVD